MKTLTLSPYQAEILSLIYKGELVLIKIKKPKKKPKSNRNLK